MVLLRCGIAALAGIAMSGGLQGCAMLEQGINTTVEVTCKLRLGTILDGVEKKYDDLVKELCDKIKNGTKEKGVDVNDALKDCKSQGVSTVKEETKAEKANLTAQCINDLKNVTDLGSIKDKVKSLIDDYKPDLDLGEKLDEALADLKEEAQKAVNKTRDHLNDGLDEISDSIDGKDDDEDEKKAAEKEKDAKGGNDETSAVEKGENATRLFAAHQSLTMDSSSVVTVSLFGVALVALAGLLALVRRGVSRQVGDTEQHELLAAGEE